MPRYETVPNLTVSQRLFVERWWVNGGDVLDAVTYAGYEGLPTPSEKIQKGHRLLSSKPMKEYIAYLHRREKAERQAAAEKKAFVVAQAAARAAVGVAREAGQAAADLVSRAPYPVKSTGKQPEQETGSQIEEHDRRVGQGAGVESCVESGIAGAESCVESGVESGIFRPGSDRMQIKKDVGPLSSEGLLPPEVMLPADAQTEYGRELQPKEIRELLTNIARGNELGMRDARVRLRAIELAMRNLGMLVDLSLKANVDATSPDKLTVEERDAKVKELEAYLNKVKAKAIKAPSE